MISDRGHLLVLYGVLHTLLPEASIYLLAKSGLGRSDTVAPRFVLLVLFT